jgi:hypothetical protein
MNDLPTSPERPVAPLVLEQRPALERELAEVRLQVPERVLAVYEGKPEAREKLAALISEIRTIEFQIECNGMAHELALRLDRDAVAAWRRQIEADPEQATEGITRKKCCTLCSKPYGCVITGDICAHPLLSGIGVGPRHMGNPTVRAMFSAASKHLEIPGYCDDPEDDGDDEEDEIEEQAA